MKVLVLGGTRLIGKHLVNELISRGHDVTIVTRGIARDNFGDKITRLIADRTNQESLRRHIPDITYDVVFDSLAYSSNDVKRLLSTVKCRRYIETSTVSVYDRLHWDLREEEFDARKKELVYCDRFDFSYDETKRQAECAIMQEYSSLPSAMVRFPFVIGEDDYSKRFHFYVEHIMKHTPVFVDGLNAQMAFVRSDEAGKFLAFLGESDFTGAINGASEQTISIAQAAEYIKGKTGKSIVLSEDGEQAPYNGVEDYDLNIDKAKALGFAFTPLADWIKDLMDNCLLTL